MNEANKKISKKQSHYRTIDSESNLKERNPQQPNNKYVEQVNITRAHARVSVCVC